MSGGLTRLPVTANVHATPAIDTTDLTPSNGSCLDSNWHSARDGLGTAGVSFSLSLLSHSSAVERFIAVTGSGGS
jgi:hypothetical protein